ncbi:MAG TPA: tetratricopeptide repeat protein [Cyclobacteriaceae bacterium]|jgi:tetratricopeptide (TPR) repeat protein|nr:tetratricopeptide repeat protein [Cyclobacteriaceae bacterium]
MKHRKIYGLLNVLITIFCLGWTQKVECQSLFTAWQNQQAKAGKAYADGNFREAVERYEDVFEKHPTEEINLRIARCYHFIGDHHQCVSWYERFMNRSGVLLSDDQFNCAESYASLGNYESAIVYYEKILTQSPDDLIIAKKIWRLKNIQYLLEDSTHYAVQSININSPENEFGGMPFRDGMLFLSNREKVSVVVRRDAATQMSFYHSYFSPFIKDTMGVDAGHYGEPDFFKKGYIANFQEGPFSFFNKENNMVYTASANKPGNDRARTLQLYFAEWKNGKWITTYPFPYNSATYSVTDPSISENGKVLYFSSDMKGGQGGKDLYRCDYSQGKWNKPVNLIDINTRYDESYPFVQNRVLYFSSTGQAGMGGLDVFKVDILSDGFGEIVNMGYPINTHADDFSFVVDSLGTKGYFSSNRGDTHDDIYRVDIDMQTYPIVMEGTLRFKEIGSQDSLALKPLPNVKLILIDNVKGVTVSEIMADSLGNFVLQIPYFSQYKLKVVEENKNETVVSLGVPRHRKKEEKHDIVVVREIFKVSP